MTFVQTPKPIPTSFAHESFYAVSAFRFTDGNGISRYGRYRILPVAGNDYLTDAAAAAQSPDFLFAEIKARITREPVRFRVAVQLAETGDITDDATMRWPDERPQVAFGEINLTAVVSDNAKAQQHIIFDRYRVRTASRPRRTRFFEPRANIYLMTGRRRRATGAGVAVGSAAASVPTAITSDTRLDAYDRRVLQF